jgi:hypothetical protein
MRVTQRDERNRTDAIEGVMQDEGNRPVEI